MLDLFANVDFALSAWLCYTLVGFMFTPGCDCCGEPSIPCEYCHDEWNYPDSGDVGTAMGDGDVSESPDTWANETYLGGGEPWVNPSNAAASDDARATVLLDDSLGPVSQWLKGTAVGFNLPPGVTIVGIAVNVECRNNGTQTVNGRVQMVQGGTITGDESAPQNLNNGTDTTLTFGGATELWGLTWTDADINASNFGTAFRADCGTSVLETAEVDLITITVYYEGANGCGFQETSGVWSVVGLRMHTDSANAIALASFTPANADFAATFEWAIGGSGDEMRFIFNWQDASNYSYLEFKTTDVGVTDGHIRIVDVVATVHNQVAILTDTDLGAPFVSPSTLMTVDICLTPTWVFVSAIGVCLEAGGAWGEPAWGFGTGQNSGGFDVNFVTVQENGIDGDGNPCGCEIDCQSECPDELQVDMDDWVNDECADCGDHNTTFFLPRNNCNTFPVASVGCDVDSGACIWSMQLETCANDSDPVQNALCNMTAFLTEDRITLNVTHAEPVIGFQTHQWTHSDPFDRDADCLTLVDFALPDYESGCAPSVDSGFLQCDASAVVPLISS